MTLAIVTLLWDPTDKSESFSRCYDETWVERLYWGFERNLTQPFEFIVYTDRPRQFTVPVMQVKLPRGKPDYGWCILPYMLGRPMILVGLDTIVTGNIDHLAEYCMTADRFACPRDPYHPHQVCNGVALVPAGHQRIGLEWAGANDMVWVRKYDPLVIDDMFHEQIVSYKGHVKPKGLGDARIVYFHGLEKPHELQGLEWVRQHWNGEDMSDRQTMDPRSGNHPAMLPGEIIPGASGWKERERRALGRLQKKGNDERAAIRAARAKLMANQEAAPIALAIEAAVEEVKAVVAAVEPAEPAAPAEPATPADMAEMTEMPDDLSVLAWQDLRAFYELVLGEKPGGQMRRSDVEAAIRRAREAVDGNEEKADQ